MLDELSLHELDIILIVLRRCDVRLPVGSWESELFDILITMPTETAVQNEASQSSCISYFWFVKPDKLFSETHILTSVDCLVRLYRRIIAITLDYNMQYPLQWLIGSLAKTLKYLKGSVEREKKQAFADKYGDILQLFSPHVRVHLLAMITYNVPARSQ